MRSSLQLLAGTAFAFAAATLSNLPANAAAFAPTDLVSKQNVVRMAAPTDTVKLVVHLPLRNRAGLENLIASQSNRHSPMWKHWLTPQQFAAEFGPTAATQASAVSTLRGLGFTIKGVGVQGIQVTTTAAGVQRVFGIPMAWVKDKAGTYLAAHGHMRMPSVLTALNADVVGLDTAPRPHAMSAKISASRFNPANRYSPYGSYYFDDLKQAYGYPSYSSYNGAGKVVVAVGTNPYSQVDNDSYFAHERLGGSSSLDPEPYQAEINDCSCSFGQSEGDSFEANLDIQQIGGSAPGVADIHVSIPNSIADFLLVYQALASDNAADVISTSYGQCELFYTAAYNGGTSYTSELTSDFHDAFAQLASQGTTVVFSSDDNAGYTCPNVADTAMILSTGIWIDDPDVIGVGGTNLETSSGSSTASTYVTENAVADYVGTGNCEDPEGQPDTCLLPNWWGSGGGVSQVFPVPSFQSGLTTMGSVHAATALTGRGVPDVAMHMGGCPGTEQAGELCNTNPPYPNGLFDSSDIEQFEGSTYGAIGTSASAPEFAGYVATLDQACACRLGNINYWLYDFKTGGFGAFHQGIPSFNGAVTYTGMGWNPIIGVGTPNMEGLFAVLGVTTVPAAGNPLTASNP